MVESPDGSIGSALSYQYLSSIVFVASGGFFYILIAKFLPTSSVGVIALILAITSLLNIVFSFGFPVSAQHFISFNLGKGDSVEMHSLARRLFLIGIVLSIASVAFTLIMAKPFAILFFHNETYSIFVDIASLYVAAQIIFGILHGSALGLQLFKTDALIYLSSASISYFLGLLFLFIFHSIHDLLIGISLSYLYGSLLYVIVIFFRKPSVTKRSKKTTLNLIFSYSWPLILSGLVGYGSGYVDRFVVAYFFDISTLGIYSFVLTVSSSFSFFAGPIVNILVPKLSEFFSINDRESLIKGINLSSALLTLFYSPLALGVASLAPLILSLLANSAYERGYPALIILFFFSSIFILTNVMGSVIYAVRRTRVYVLSTSLTLASNVILSFLLIPRSGMVGAAIANSSVMVVSFVVLYYYSVIKVTGSYNWAMVLKIWFSSLIMFVSVTVERTVVGYHIIALPLYVLTGAAVYLSALNLTHPLRKLNRDEFLSYLPARFNIRKAVDVLLRRAF